MNPSSPKIFIVKVQIPLAGEGGILVYDEYRSLEMMLPRSSAVAARMGTKVKKYFYAHLGHLEADIQVLHLNEEAPEQVW